MEILKELQRREALAAAIDILIDKLYIPCPNNKIRRGQQQNLIAQILGVTNNNVLTSTVTERMNKRGYISCIVQGNSYYRHVALNLHPK